jgi:hypothetical protein
MLPAGSKRVAAAAAEAAALSALAPLPLALAQRIFSLVPVDSRARASCVARGWHAALAEPALWTRLDLSKGSGVACALNADALLQGAAARAQGLLCYLDVSSAPRGFTADVVLAVLAANVGSLRELRVDVLTSSGEPVTGFLSLTGLLGAAPLLQVVEANFLNCFLKEAANMMRGGAPWAPLRFSSLRVLFDRPLMESVLSFAATLADAALQPALSELTICSADTSQPDVMNALMDAALARKLNRLAFSRCTPPAPAPLARLLAGGSLSHLELSYAMAAPLFDAAGAAVVADALRATTALTSLNLSRAGLCRDMPATAALLGALVGHPSLRALRLDGEQVADDDGAPLGAALAALVAADAPALQHIRISDSALGYAGLAPLVDALSRNRHLRSLNIARTGMSEQFARERLLPAVRANTSLHELCCGYGDLPQAAAEAQVLVKERLQRS